jgi:large subunit ribosomal protein L23
LTIIGEKLNRYGFVVNKKANKLQIKNAVQQMYGVNVVAVNTLVMGGKNKFRNTKTGIVKGRTSTFKKAVITLADGEKIDFYSNI